MVVFNENQREKGPKGFFRSRSSILGQPLAYEHDWTDAGGTKAELSESSCLLSGEIGFNKRTVIKRFSSLVIHRTKKRNESDGNR